MLSKAIVIPLLVAAFFVVVAGRTGTVKGCPILNPLIQPRCAEPSEPPCKSNKDCADGKICCPGYCYNSCVFPAKPGTCPEVSEPKPQCLLYQNDCNVDSDCKGTMKCCETDCGIGCVEPSGN